MTKWLVRALFRLRPGTPLLREATREMRSSSGIPILHDWRQAIAVRGEEYLLSRWLFLRLLALVYLFALLSLALEVKGLIGTGGILPADRFLEAASRHYGAGAYWLLPTLGWISASDAFLQGLCWCGVIAAILLLLGWQTTPALAFLWI